MASLIEDNRDRSVGMKKATMTSLMEDPEAVGKTSEKKRKKNRKKKAKKAAQQSKKKKEEEATLAAEQSAQQALDNKKAEEDDEWNERYYGPQGKPQKAPPILSMMGVMPVINKATYEIQAKHTKAVPLKLADNTTTLIRIPREYTKKPQTVTQEEFAAMSPAEQDIVIGDEINLHVKNAVQRSREGWNPNLTLTHATPDSDSDVDGGYKRKKRKKRRKTKRRRKTRRKTKRRRKTRRKTKRRKRR